MWLIFGVGITESRELVMRDVIAYLCTVWDSCAQSNMELIKHSSIVLNSHRVQKLLLCSTTLVPDCTCANVNTVVVFP